jgi:hypothetical protein
MLELHVNMKSVTPSSPDGKPSNRTSEGLLAVLASRKLSQDDIINDSGISVHIFNDLKWFSELAPLPIKMAFASANSGDCITEYVGITYFKAIQSDGGITQMDL